MADKNQLAMVVAPILSWRGCSLEFDEFEISKNLLLVRNPRIELGENYERRIGEDAVEWMNSAEWGLQYSYQADHKTHLGPAEESANEIVQLAALALWINKPTYATLKFLIWYHPVMYDGKRASGTNEFLDFFRPNPRFRMATYSAEDLEGLRKIHRKVRDVFKGHTNLNMTLRYLHSALHQYFIEPRFVLFTVVLESLFSTGNQEMTHKISERVAYLMGKDREGKKGLFRTVKRLYSIRSTIVHGGDLSKKLKKDEKFEDLMGDIETMVNRIVRRILLDEDLLKAFSGVDERRETFFADQLFS